jgi:hypothetical protein
VLGAVSGALAFPHPVGRVATAAGGVLLLVLAAALWRLPIGLGGLAAGNIVTALAAVVWLVAATGFSTGAAALVGAAVTGLVALGAAEIALSRGA